MDINQIEPIARLVNEFSKLPSVGRKTAERYAYSIIKASDEQVKGFVTSDGEEIRAEYLIIAPGREGADWLTKEFF